MTRAWNFSPGPATLPESVLQQAQATLVEYGDAGASVLEISHRGPAFMAIAARTEADLRTLLVIPDEYAVLFTSGGATTVQALLPLNIAQAGQQADYLVTGHWSRTAIRQAQPTVAVNVVANSEDDGFRHVPARDTWRLSADAAYVHVTANETIHGVELHAIPDVGDVPLVADVSSSIASAPLDVSRFGVLYAGAQKNLGPSGISVVIMRRDLLERSGQPRAPIFDYRAQLAADSMLNTPPSWNWYVLGLTVRWMLDEGGVTVFGERNARKAATLYAAIDGSGGFYRNPVQREARSRMNVPFFLDDRALEAVFLQQAQAAGLIGLKGHKVLGGMRASLYNAMPQAGVEALVAFMRDFQRTHG